MKILIRVSEMMDKESKNLRSLESRYIRVPFELRDICNLEVGDFLNLRSKIGKLITLSVTSAYKEDVTIDPLAAYVSPEVFNALDLENTSKYEQEIEVVDNITLGCDPELFLVNRTNKLTITARDFFKRWGQLGYDGVLMEIRPLPSTSEEVVTDNIYNLICQARKVMNSNKKIDGSSIIMMAASHYMGITAGFHLHFGLSPGILGSRIDILGQRVGPKADLLRQVVRALDYYVGIPTTILEGQEDSIRRTAPYLEYGKPSDHRIDNRTLEYRMPGGALLRHPILTKGMLGLGAIVVEDIISRIKICTDSFENLKNMSSRKDLIGLYPNVPAIYEMFRIVCSKDLTMAKRHLEVVTKDLNQMVGFEKRKKSIEEFFECIYNGTQFSYNIEENWRAYYGEKFERKMDVLSASF